MLADHQSCSAAPDLHIKIIQQTAMTITFIQYLFMLAVSVRPMYEIHHIVYALALVRLSDPYPTTCRCDRHPFILTPAKKNVITSSLIYE